MRTSLAKQLETTFSEYTQTSALAEIASCSSRAKLILVDRHVQDLIAVPGRVDLSSHQAYKDGMLIFQEKASCFPAALLDPASLQGNIIDACAAPGNKTTHLAALIATKADQDVERRQIIACEKDAARSLTLTKMVKLAGVDRSVQVKTSQDFMRLDPTKYPKVQALLLDPSCSGSGIVGRDEATVVIHLPSREAAKDAPSKGRKRKRDDTGPVHVQLDTASNEPAEEEMPEDVENDAAKLQTRLAKLSGFQLRLLERAMSFPAANRITYSTCSLHREENEHVVVKALLSDVAKNGGWRILKRNEEVDGMRQWPLRGNLEAVATIARQQGSVLSDMNIEDVTEGCLRCEKGGEGGTMGFFVAGFVRDRACKLEDLDSRTKGTEPADSPANTVASTSVVDAGEDGDDEWYGFSDDER